MEGIFLFYLFIFCFYFFLFFLNLLCWNCCLFSLFLTQTITSKVLTCLWFAIGSKYSLILSLPLLKCISLYSGHAQLLNLFTCTATSKTWTKKKTFMYNVYGHQNSYNISYTIQIISQIRTILLSHCLYSTVFVGGFACFCGENTVFSGKS